MPSVIPTALRLLILACILTGFLQATVKTDKCRQDEFACGNGRCIPSNRFCDSKDDCGDSSDEVRYCTRCNRTYYGLVGKTYDLELHRPKEDKIPFVCHITFTADGGEYGDLIQITFDSFTLGRFVSFMTDGCPDGALQITESNRPQVRGSWCGTSWGPVMYYSETKSITIHVNLLKLSKIENGYNFDYRMEYKFLRKRAAVVRYGGRHKKRRKGAFPPFFNVSLPTSSPEPEYYLGELIPGTYCSRIFSDCDKKHCRLQSPNFPGVYPRNLTCYYAVRQHEIPPGKHALIVVRQPKGQLISIRSESTLYGTATPRELKVWNECDDVQDYVTVYDGYTTRDAVILKFCGGGEAVPEAISSGHELLVEFSTSPYGTFLQPTPVNGLHGFQLEVEVKFVDQQAPSFVKQKRNCEFWLRGTNRGILESPIHSLPANTTCLYHLQGMDPLASTSPAPFRPLNSRYPDWRSVGMITPPPRYRVWLSILKFHAGNSWDPRAPDKMCRSYLNVWDGLLWHPSNCEGLFCGSKEKYNTEKFATNSIPKTIASSSKGGKNVTMLARFCREHIPRSCEHFLLANLTRKFPRPCSFTESYLTSGDTLTLELKLADSTALKPISFKALYEFVDLHLDGDPYGPGPCSRKFTAMENEASQKFRSPPDIFLYGRGGSKNISCVYRFEGQKGETIKITLDDVRINRECDTQVNPDTERLECSGNISATLRFFEVPWNDVPGIPRDCLCGVDKNKLLPYTYISSSNVVELRFDVTGMNASDDFTSLYFEGHWKFIRTPVCELDLRKSGANGELLFRHPAEGQEVNCENSPRVFLPGHNKFLYLKIGGAILGHSSRWSNNNTLRSMSWTSHTCKTRNRIIVHTALYTALICPEDVVSRDKMVEVFSDGWTINANSKNTVGQLTLDKVEVDSLGQELPRTVAVEFYGKEPGSYPVMWLELMRRKDIPPNGLGIFMIKSDHCQYKCPELDACINASVWCDGIEDCPSGTDEALTHCSILLQLPPIYLLIGIVFVLICSSVLGYLIWKTCRRRPRSILQTRLQSLSSDTAIVEEKSGTGVICS